MKKMLLLGALAPGLCWAHPPAELINLSMLHVDQMVAVQEQVCAARAPAQGKKFSQALDKWRSVNKELLNDLQQASMAIETAASAKMSEPADKAELQKGVESLFTLTAARQLAGNQIFSEFARLTDAQANQVCAGYVSDAKGDAWLRSEMLAALASAAREK